MPGLGYTQGGPDRAASITEFHNRHSRDCKVPMASSVSVSHHLNRSEASSSLDGLLSSRALETIIVSFCMLQSKARPRVLYDDPLEK